MLKHSVFSWLVLAVLTISLVSCNADQEFNQGLENFSFTASQITQDTKSYYDLSGLEYEYFNIEWENGDKVGTFGSWTKNAAFTASYPDYEVVFSGKITRGDRLKYAYYPYNPSATNFRAVPVSVKSTQVMAEDGSTDGNDLRASNSIRQTGGKVDFQFQYLTSYMMLYLDLSEVQGLLDDEYVERYTIENMEGRKIAGDYTLNLAYLRLTEVEGTNAVTVETPSHPYVYDGQISTIMSILPNMKRLDRIRMTIETNYHKIGCVFTCTANYAAGIGYIVKVNLAELDSVLNEVTILSKGENPNPDHVDATKRELAWQQGEEFVIGGETFSRANSGLSEVYVSTEIIVNDASLHNSVVFVEPGAILFLGSNATLSNTIIMSNDPDEKAEIQGIMTSGDSNDPSFIALYDMNLHNDYNSVRVAGEGLETLIVDSCDVIATTDDAIVDFMDFYGDTFGNLVIVNNKFHSATFAPVAYELALEEEWIELDNLIVKNNMFIGVKATDALISSSINNIDVETNHFFYLSKCNDSFAIVSSEIEPESVISVSNSYYVGSNATGKVAAYSTPSISGYAAAASSAPITITDYDDFSYTINTKMIETRALVDGESELVSLNKIAKTGTVAHSPSGSELEYFVLPGVEVAEGGSWPLAKTATFSYDGASDTYTFSLPDYVDPSTVQTLNSESGWTLAWADEFNGTSWDSDVWTRCPQSTPDWAKEQWPADESLVEVSNGALVTWAKKDSDTSKGNGGYITGGVWSKDKKGFDLGQAVNGRIDIRARMTQAKGYWPAIWMMDYNGLPWPQGGEIDIMEHLNFESKVYTTLHYGTSSNEKKVNVEPSISDVTEYHTYTVLISNDSLKTYVDGVLYMNINKSNYTESGAWPWDQSKFYLIMDSQLNGGWVGQADGTNLPAHMDIDYVRYMVK